MGAKLGNFELRGWGAHVCYSLPSLLEPSVLVLARVFSGSAAQRLPPPFLGESVPSLHAVVSWDRERILPGKV